MEFFRKLLDTSDFPARWYCGVWTAGHGWLHIVSDLMIWGAYTAIPAVLAYFIIRRRDMPFPRVFLLFACFIYACGTTHFIEAMIFWWPMYRVSGVAKAATAIVSWATVAALIPITPRALALPGLKKVNEQLEHEITERTAAEREARESESRLRTIMDAAAEAIICVGAAGRVVWANPAANRIFGVDGANLPLVDQFIPNFAEVSRDALDPGRTWHGVSDLVLRQETTARRGNGEEIPVEVVISEAPLAGRVVQIVVCRDISELRRARRQQELMLAELNHRVRNLFATVHATAMQTVRHSASLADFERSFSGRLQALGQTNVLLTQADWKGAALCDLLRQELEPRAGRADNVILSGPPVFLRPGAAMALHMVLHELATNAAKYGALSVSSGRIAVSWHIDAARNGATLVIRWVESDGPPVQPPRRRGLGTEVIQASLEYGLDGATQVEFRPEGVRCEMRLPLSDKIGHVG